jgi:signal peptidase II
MKKLVGPLTLALAILIADRASKLWVLKHVTAWDIWPIIPGFMNIIHAENPGMAFSLLSTASESTRAFVLIGLATVVLSVVAVMLWRSTGTAERWALALVLGGAVGNLWDRIARGTVTDFVDVYYGDWHWATFNVADSAITVGALLLALQMLISKEPEAARVP